MKRKQTLEDYGLERTKRLTVRYEISDLPIDVMVLIFKLLTPTQRRDVMPVCRDWLKFVSDFFPRDNCIVLTENSNFSRAGMLYKTFANRIETYKGARHFPYLKIKSFPNEIAEVRKLSRFIDLIGEGVKFLTIDVSFCEIDWTEPPNNLPSNWFNDKLYLKMPNLKSLEIEDDDMLGDLRFPKDLQTIKVNYELHDLEQLIKIQKIKTIQTLTSGAVKLYNNSYEPHVSFIEPSFKVLLKEMLGSNPKTSVVLHSNYNYCGTSKLSTNDITEMRFEQGFNSLSPSILSKFKNLKSLRFSTDEPPGSVLTTKQVQYSGITHLHFFGFRVQSLSHFDKSLTSFPDLEHLTIDGFKLQSEHFSLICKFMPKLKELILMNYGWTSNEISIEAILDQNAFSLKDLKNLEKLEISTKYATPNESNFHWPHLPNLKKLSLIGRCFNFFDQEMYSEIAQNCPNVAKLHIDTMGVRSPSLKFLPMVYQWDLTHLSLPGEGRSDDEGNGEPNETLIGNVIENCENLQVLTIKDNVGFSLEQEVQMFTVMASLKMIISEITSDELPARIRVMSQKDFQNLKPYLAENLHNYKNLNETIEYVIDAIIPADKRVQMYRSFESHFPEEENENELKNLYIVAHYFLKMRAIDFCKLLINNQHTNQD